MMHRRPESIASSITACSVRAGIGWTRTPSNSQAGGSDPVMAGLLHLKRAPQPAERTPGRDETEAPERGQQEPRPHVERAVDGGRAHEVAKGGHLFPDRPLEFRAGEDVTCEVGVPPD